MHLIHPPKKKQLVGWDTDSCRVAIESVIFLVIPVLMLVTFPACKRPIGPSVTTSALSITLSPYSGPVGTTINVTGSGFAANTYGSVFFDINRNGTNDSGEPIQYVTTSATGNFSTALAISSVPSAPPMPPSKYPILASFPFGQPAQASATFIVTATMTTTPVMTLSPYSGPVGTTINVTGSGFAANTYGSVFFDIDRNGTNDPGEPIQYVATSLTGNFSTALTISSVPSAPPVPSGTYPILASFPFRQPAQASATFTVTASTTGGVSMILSPNAGAVGSTITIIGSGFPANTYGSVFFDVNGNGTNDPGEPIQYVTTSSIGNFSTALIVPSAPPGTYLVLPSFPFGQPAQASAAFTVITP